MRPGPHERLLDGLLRLGSVASHRVELADKPPERSRIEVGEVFGADFSAFLSGCPRPIVEQPGQPYAKTAAAGLGVTKVSFGATRWAARRYGLRRCTPPGPEQEATDEAEPQAGIGGWAARGCSDRRRWRWLGAGGRGTYRPRGIAPDGRSPEGSEAVATKGSRIDGAYADAVADRTAAGSVGSVGAADPAAGAVASVGSVAPADPAAGTVGPVAAADRTAARSLDSVAAAGRTTAAALADTGPVTCAYYLAGPLPGPSRPARAEERIQSPTRLSLLDAVVT